MTEQQKSKLDEIYGEQCADTDGLAKERDALQSQLIHAERVAYDLRSERNRMAAEIAELKKAVQAWVNISEFFQNDAKRLSGIAKAAANGDHANAFPNGRAVTRDDVMLPANALRHSQQWKLKP